MKPESDGKVTLYTPEGQVVRAWPVDAREMIKYNYYSLCGLVVDGPPPIAPVVEDPFDDGDVQTETALEDFISEAPSKSRPKRK